MQPEKKQLEILIMDYFRKINADFPKGKILPTESPDFTINLKSHRVLGIELTRLNPGNAQVPDDLTLVENRFREQIIQRTKSLFEQRSKLKLFVKFLFSDTNKITPERELMVAVQAGNAIRTAIEFKSSNSFFNISIPQSRLPEGIDEILLLNHPCMETSIWERSNNLGISNDVVDDIRKAIYKKDEKLRLYQRNRLNYYWLLITTDRLRGLKSVNLPNKLDQNRFESRFQQVFLFDLMKAEIYPLV